MAGIFPAFAKGQNGGQVSPDLYPQPTIVWDKHNGVYERADQLHCLFASRVVLQGLMQRRNLAPVEFSETATAMEYAAYQLGKINHKLDRIIAALGSAS